MFLIGKLLIDRYGQLNQIYNRSGSGRHVRDRPGPISPAHQQAVAARRRGHVSDESAAGHGQDQEPRGSGRHDQEDVSPEGHGQRPGRFAPQRRSSWRRHIFAKRPRDFSYRLPKKALRLATRMAVASQTADGQMVLIDDPQFDAPKTKDMAAILKALGLAGGSVLVTTAAGQCKRLQKCPQYRQGDGVAGRGVERLGGP